MVVTWQNIPAHLAAQAEDFQQGTIGSDTSHLNLPSSRVYEGTTRTIAGHGEEQLGTARHVVSHQGAAGGSVMATRQRVNGHDTVEVIPGNPGSRTYLRMALQDGLIRETAPGVYEDVSAADGSQRTAETVQREEQAAQETKAAEQAEYVDADDETAWAEDIAPLPQHAYDAACASAIGSVLRGDSFAETAKALAHNANISPELASEYVSEGAAKAERMVARALAPLGLTGERLEQFYADLREQPEKLHAAIERAWYANDAGGFRELAGAWRANNPGPELAMYQQAGFETHVDRQTGDILVRQDGRNWVSMADVIKHASSAPSTPPARPAAAPPQKATTDRLMLDPVSGEWITEREYWGQ